MAASSAVGDRRRRAGGAQQLDAVAEGEHGQLVSRHQAPLQLGQVALRPDAAGGIDARRGVDGGDQGETVARHAGGQGEAGEGQHQGDVGTAAQSRGEAPDRVRSPDEEGDGDQQQQRRRVTQREAERRRVGEDVGEAGGVHHARRRAASHSMISSVAAAA
jgi:hypothetical protein